MYVAPIEIGPLTIHPFGLLAAVSLLVGLRLARRDAPRQGLDPAELRRAEPWLAAGLFIGAHAYAVLIDYPRRTAEDPWVILRFWDGISSFGGALGILVTAGAYCRRRGIPLSRFADCYSRAFPVAWIFGRLGCTFAFDHPGELTDFPLGMHYPGIVPGVASGIRHNLGFYEVLYSTGLAALFWLPKERRSGSYVTALMLTYMPMRFVLDFLRVAETLYLGLTASQWLCIGGFLFGLVLLHRQSSA